MTDERRLVTVLFADVVGSTALGEALDPEDTRALLGRLFAVARDAVEERGGRVEKFIGDAIMAIFGLPAAHDDDAERALAAALDLRDRVRGDERLSSRIAIRLGVNGGEVVATSDPSAREFLVTGDPVNVAARLQSAAEPWGILVGERTVGAARDHFAFGPAVEVEAKGKSSSVTARSLLGPAAPQRSPVRHRLVGRDADLAQLELIERRTLDEHRPYLVNVIAPAGVGKTRLIEEFLDRLPPDVAVATAQCLPYGQRLTYWPMRAILLSVAGLPDDASPEAIRPAVQAWLADAGDPDPRRTGEQLSATIGAAEIESGDRVALFGAWRRFIELAAERRPLILVLEDLHWSSDSLLDLFEAILQPRTDVPLLLVAMARPELLDRRPSWGGGRRNAVSIALEPLPRSAVAELVADLLETPAPALVDAVVERAEGNPFYAGEIVRELIDRVGPTPDEGALRAAIETLPDTVQTTVLARLDALDRDARRVAQLGAVLGRSFQPAAVPSLDPELSEARVDAATDQLIERDLVRPTSRGLLTFRHILIREVAYGMLTRAERARLHAAAGGWLEHLAVESHREDELAELVAFHLREANSLGGILGASPDPLEVARTVRWLRRAGDAAFAGAASTEAARHLNAAIEIAPRQDLPELYERLGQIWTGGDQALEAFEAALALGRELGLGPDQELRILAQAVIVAARWLGSVSTAWNEEEAQTRFARLRELIAADTSEAARLLGWLALSFGLGTVVPGRTAEELQEAEAAGERAEALARRAGDASLISAALDARGSVLLQDDQIDRISALVAERHAIADDLNASERLDAGVVAAWMNSLAGRLADAEQGAAETRAGLGAGQGSAWSLGASAWRVLALYALGRWDEALLEASRAERSWQESALRAPWFALNGFLAAAAICRARADTVAFDHWRIACRTIFDRSDPEIRTQRMSGFIDDDAASLAVYALGERGDLGVFAGRLDYVFLALAFLADRRQPADRELLDRLIEYTEARSIVLVSTQARRLRGVIEAREDDLATALAGFEAMSARPFVARASIELGRLRGDQRLVEAGTAELDQLGDVEHAARVAAEIRSAGPPAVEHD